MSNVCHRTNFHILLFSYEQLLLHSLDCIELLLSKVAPLTDSSIFEISFTLFITILDQGDSDSTSAPQSQSLIDLIRLSDDTRLVLLCHLKTLLSICDQSVFNALMMNNSQFKFKLGFFITVLLKLTKKSKYFKIHASSLDLLSVFYLKSVSLLFDTFDFGITYTPGHETNGFVVNMTAFTLPSIISTIAKLISVCSGSGNHYKLHSSVIVASLRLLYIVLTITFNTRQTFNKIEEKDKIDDKGHSLPEVKFTKDWFDKTTENICFILRPIFDTLLEHPDISVCCALQKTASNLILNTCTSFMLRSVDIIIRVPIAYFDEPQSAHFDAQFKELTSNLSKTEFDQLRSILENELLSHINQTLQSCSTDTLLSSLRILSGFFQILDSESLFRLFFLITQHKSKLFRLLIKLSQFDYKRKLQQVKVEEHFEEHLDPTAHNQDQVDDLFDAFDLPQYLIYLNSAPLVQTYLTFVRKLVVNESSFTILYDYLIELLSESQFDPAVLLLFNCLLSGISKQMVPSLRNYIDELLKLYCMQLELSSLKHFHEEENRDSEKTLRPLSISQLSSICTPSSMSPALSLKIDQHEPTKATNEKHFIYQQCLLLQGITSIYSLLNSIDPATKTVFFRHLFCYFLEASSCEVHLVANIAEKMLLFLGRRFNCGDGKIAKMVLENLDYLYSSMTVALDYDILRQNDDENDVNRLETVFSVDTYSLKTVQVALQTVLRLLRQLHRSSKSVDLKDLDYLHRLMDQILNVIKYYSIHPLPRYTANLNRLLTILCAYLELVEAVCDQDAHFSRRIEEKTQEEKITLTTAFLEDYISSFLFMKAQDEVDFRDDNVGDDVDENKILKEVSEQANKEELEKRSILESPIVKSRVADILNQCSFILSDANVDIRLNVLLLACKSMKLLRSYEGMLIQLILSMLY